VRLDTQGRKPWAVLSDPFGVEEDGCASVPRVGNPGLCCPTPSGSRRVGAPQYPGQETLGCVVRPLRGRGGCVRLDTQGSEALGCVVRPLRGRGGCVRLRTQGRKPWAVLSDPFGVEESACASIPRARKPWAVLSDPFGVERQGTAIAPRTSHTRCPGAVGAPARAAE